MQFTQKGIEKEDMMCYDDVIINPSLVQREPDHWVLTVLINASRVWKGFSHQIISYGDVKEVRL